MWLHPTVRSTRYWHAGQRCQPCSFANSSIASSKSRRGAHFRPRCAASLQLPHVSVRHSLHRSTTGVAEAAPRKAEQVGLRQYTRSSVLNSRALHWYSLMRCAPRCARTVSSSIGVWQHFGGKSDSSLVAFSNIVCRQETSRECPHGASMTMSSIASRQIVHIVGGEREDIKGREGAGSAQ